MKINPDKKEMEVDIWQKDLADILHENALLKYMLSAIVDANEEKDFLPVAEYFQNELLLKDERLRNLMKEISEFASEEYIYYNERWNEKHEKLGKEISVFRKEYNAFSENFKSKCHKDSSG